MRDYTIITDSTCDLSPELADSYNIKVSTLSVILEGKSYRNYLDGREITNKQLYESMRSKKLPTTSACNAADFMEVMEPELQKGNDILYLAFSSTMSCTYNVGCTVAETLMQAYPGSRIVTVDTLAASYGLGLLVYMTALYKAKGATIDEAAAYAEENKLNMCHAFTVNDLFHIMRGGRINKAGALVGSLLSIKPILRVNDDGLIQSAATTHGRRKALHALIEQIRVNLTDPDLPFFVGHGDCDEVAEEFVTELKEELGLTNVIVGYIGAVCGCHGGPDLLGCFYHGKSRGPVSASLSEVS